MPPTPPLDLICFGSATEDVFVHVPEAKIVCFSDEHCDTSYVALEYGAKVEAQDVMIEVGGGATNTATTFARMGLRTGIVAKVGGDGPGDRVLAAMQAEGVSTDHIARDPDHRTGYSVILTGYTGERTILVYRGANAALRPEDVHWDDLAAASWVYLNSLGGDSAPLFMEVARFCGQRGVKLGLNPGSQQLALGMEGLAEAFAHTTALFLNKSEAYEVTGVEPERGPGDEVEMLNRLRQAGCKTVVMTDGGQGSEGMDETGHYQVPAVQVQVQSTVGAGDAFASACLVALHRGMSLPQAMRIGAVNAASVISHLGAKRGVLRWEEATATLNVER